MATGTSLDEVDVPVRTGAHPGGRSAGPRRRPGRSGRRGRWRVAARWVVAGALVLGVVVGSPGRPPEPADAAPRQGEEPLPEAPSEEPSDEPTDEATEPSDDPGEEPADPAEEDSAEGDAEEDEVDDVDGDGDAATGPVPDSDHVLGSGSCAGVDEVAGTGRGGGRFLSYEAYGDEWLGAMANGATAQEIAEADDICIPEGYVLLTCKAINDNAPDNEGVVQVHADLPRWWFEAIEVESTTNGGNSCEMASHKPSKACDELGYLVTVNVTATYSYTYLETDDFDYPGIIPDKCWGTYPSALYQVSWHEGDGFTAWNDNLMGWLTDLSFGIGKGAITAVLWLVEFGFDEFSITRYADQVRDIADNYQLHLIGPFDLLDLVWFWLVAWVAFAALRGRLAMAGGEVLMTLALLTLATVLYGNRIDYFRDTATFMDLSSKAMLTAAQGEDPTDDDDMLRVLQGLGAQVHRQFVELPHEYLNWGTVLPDDCRTAANQVMAANYDDDGWPARHMRRAGEECEQYAEYNDDANTTRMFAAILTMIVSWIVALTLGITAFTVLVCKFLLAVLFATTPFVMLSAVLPGTGRRLFWSWTGSLLQLVLAVVGSGGLVALELIGVDAVVSKSEDQDLIARWFLVLMVVAVVFFARRKMIGLAQKWATSTADNLTRLSPGSAHWSGGGSVGFDLDRVDRGAMASLRGVGHAAKYGTWIGGAAALGGVGLVGGNALQRLQDRRNKKHGARNLAYNRQMLHEFEQRPRTVHRIGNREMTLASPLTRAERRRNDLAQAAFYGHGRHPAVEVIDHGKRPNTFRYLPTYRVRPKRPPQPTYQPRPKRPLPPLPTKPARQPMPPPPPRSPTPPPMPPTPPGPAPGPAPTDPFGTPAGKPFPPPSPKGGQRRRRPKGRRRRRR
jgi:TrbL/VirB6 plasmid conjugal transfer protein